MMFYTGALSVLLFLCTSDITIGFLPLKPHTRGTSSYHQQWGQPQSPSQQCMKTKSYTSSRTSNSRLYLSSSGDDSTGRRKVSRIEGNQRDPTAEELSVMDEMITKLANAKPYELPNAVRRAFRVVSSPQFFMRIAERCDSASDSMEREKFQSLATNLVTTLEVVVETTEETLDERAKDVERVVKAAAEPDSGEFLVPLLPERIDAMWKALEGIEPSSLDEGFLSTVDAWMNKSHKDGMDLMVGIFQKLLQMYAGLQVSRARRKTTATDDNDDSSSSSTPASELLEKLLRVDTEAWDVEIRKGVSETDASIESLISEVQRTMENVVLNLENGSMAQRVQAEYLRELVVRAEEIQKSS